MKWAIRAISALTSSHSHVNAASMRLTEKTRTSTLLWLSASRTIALIVVAMVVFGHGTTVVPKVWTVISRLLICRASLQLMDM